MKKSILLYSLACVFVTTSCDELLQIATEVQNEVGGSSDSGLSISEIASGLKEALEVGTGNTVSTLNKAGGYLNSPELKIPFPPDAQRAADKLRDIGMGSLVDNFETSLNTAAENAAIKAKPIFINAIKGMTFDDARKILQGPDDAATEYFKQKTSASLFSTFTPDIKTALDNANVTKYWSKITSTYNKIPLVEAVETDLTKYATNKAMDGLFLTLEKEEKKIRENPADRVTDLLKKVFGSVAK